MSPRVYRGASLLVLAVAVPALAQDPGADETLPAQRLYYAVENRDLGRVTERGVTESTGALFSNLILAPNTRYRIHLLASSNLNVGWADFTTPGNGQSFQIPDIVVGLPVSHSSDADSLHDQGEAIVGTDPLNPDTDADGIPDGEEVIQGTDPLDGIGARTGLIASADVEGAAVDVAATNEIVVVAAGTAGITVFNVFNGMNPSAIARVPTTNAMRVAAGGTLVAVAEGSAGLTIVDVSDPPAARVVQRLGQYLLGGEAKAVAVRGRIAFVGVSSGQVLSVDMTTGTLLERVSVGSAILDLVVDGDTLVAIGRSTVHTLTYLDGLQALATVTTPRVTSSQERVFAGGGMAYVLHRNGVHLVDLTNPAAPVFVSEAGLTSFGWEHLVLDGSGLAVAAVGPNSTGNRDVSVYDLRATGNVDALLTTVVTPGKARAVAIYNGLAYVADDAAGLQVIRFLSQDLGDVAPTISLETNLGLTSAEEGQQIRVTADVADDTQVRSVEFYRDGQRVEVDGNFPFEFGFQVPSLDDQSSFRLRARVYDTGGNATFSDELTITITPDTVPPNVRGTVPRAGALLGRGTLVGLLVDEPLAPATLTATNFELLFAGDDETFGTADDAVITSGTFQFREDVLGAFRVFDESLPIGKYRATATTAITDVRGNALTSAETWEFEYYDEAADQDDDGVPDRLELLLGLDVANPDSDGDGILDGDEDPDADGLVTRAEVLYRTDPLSNDTDGDSVADGDEDEDQDTLVARLEFLAQTSPFDGDSDDDLFEDGPEVEHLSDPLDPNSIPIRFGLSLATARNDVAPKAGFAQQGVTAQNQRDPQHLGFALQEAVVQNQRDPLRALGVAEGPSVVVENQAP